MKFNSSTKRANEVENHEGAKAYSLTPELDLYSSVVTSVLERKFYEGGSERLDRIRSLIKKVSPEFVAKLAVYAREKMYLRSIPLVLVIELAKIHNGDQLVGKTVDRVVKRADEITELLAYYQLSEGREGTKKLNKISKQIQKGLARAFNRFDEYQMGKYNRATEVKLKDALFLVHPKAKDTNQQALFNKIVEGELEVPYTWETELSSLGQQKYDSEEDKKKAFTVKWEELIDSGKLGYMALLRNLRNIIQSKVSKEHFAKVCKNLADPEAVKKSRQFPFRFLSAYYELEEEVSGNASMILDALEEAIKASAENIRGFDYDTSVVIACDVSGSMEQTISDRSKIENYDIGLVLGMLLRNRCKNVITGIFGNIWKVKNLPKENILKNASSLKDINGEVGLSTNGYKVIDGLIEKEVKVDKVMIFTDCQMWNHNWDENNGSISESWNKYKKISPNSKLYIFDLSGYGNTPVNTLRPDVKLISGWSEKVFEMMEAIENGGNAVKEIENIEL